MGTITDRIYDLITQDDRLSAEEVGEDNGTVLSVIDLDTQDHYQLRIRKV